jgi:hypothetical protein
VYERGARHSGGLRRDEGSDENEVGHDDIRRLTLEIEGNFLGPVGNPPRHARFGSDGVKHPWGPPERDSTHSGRDIERMDVRLAQTDDVGAYDTK